MNIEEKPVMLKDLDREALSTIRNLAEAWWLHPGHPFFTELKRAVDEEVGYRECRPGERRPLFVISLDPLSNSQLSLLQFLFQCVGQLLEKKLNLGGARFCEQIIDAATFEAQCRGAMPGNGTVN